MSLNCSTFVCVFVYYCSTYCKAVREGERGKWRSKEPERIVRSVLLRWQSSGNEVCRGLAVGLQKKKTPKLAVHAGGCGHTGGEKRNVLIVSVLLPVAVNFALRSETQGRVEVLGMR